MTRRFGAEPTAFRVWTVGDGLVDTIMLDNRLPADTGVLGVTVASTEAEVRRVLGDGNQTSVKPLVLGYHRGDRWVSFVFDGQGTVKECSINALSTE